jgi:hypothetical protein
MVGWIYQLDTKCAIMNYVDNGCGEQTLIHRDMATKGQCAWIQLLATMFHWMAEIHKGSWLWLDCSWCR